MKKKIFVVFVLCFFLIYPYLVLSQPEEIQNSLYLNILSSNTNHQRNQWSLLIQQTLPKVGIGITLHESTGFPQIASRTWNFSSSSYDYIPQYIEGGYDILINDVSWDLDWDPTGRFDSYSLIPDGRNIYQYVNPVFDNLLELYLTTLDDLERETYAHQLQHILYVDLPSICLVYPGNLFGAQESVSGVDFQLLSLANPRPEFWENYAEDIIRYATPFELTEQNIFVSKSLSDEIWMNCVYGSLFKRQQDTHYWEPIIAKNYTISTNGLNFRIDLDSNAKFSYNNSVLAEDVAYSYALHMDPDVGSSRYTTLKKFFPNSTSIEVIDSKTLEFHFNSSCAFPFNLLSIGIIDKNTVEPLFSTYGYEIFSEDPLAGNVSDALVKSCGPFILNEFNSSNSLVKLIPNRYWNNLTNINENARLESLFFQYNVARDEAFAELYSGNVDIIDGYSPVIADFEGIAGVEGILVKTPRYEEIAVNLKHPIIGTGELTPVGTAEAAKTIRKAISHAVPRRTIVDEILEGLGTPGITPVSDFFSCFDESLKPYAYDLDLAIDYMESAGYDVLDYPEFTSHNYNKIFRNIALIALGVFVVPGGIIIYLIFVVKKIESKIYKTN